MGSSEDLMERLAVSKKIMEKTENIRRGNSNTINDNSNIIESITPKNIKYNLPDDIMVNQNEKNLNLDPTMPLDKNMVLNSKLPDEIKKLMIESPIVQQSYSSPTISNEVIEGAHRLMNLNKNEDNNTKTNLNNNLNTNILKNNSIDEIKNIIRDIVRDTVRDTVKETVSSVIKKEFLNNGMMVESTEKTNESIQFKVGKHLFIGRVTKIKKLQ